MECGAKTMKCLAKGQAIIVTGYCLALFMSGNLLASDTTVRVVAMVSGLLIGTLFTLFVLPIVYSLIARDHRSSARSERARELAEEFPDHI